MKNQATTDNAVVYRWGEVRWYTFLHFRWYVAAGPPEKEVACGSWARYGFANGNLCNFQLNETYGANGADINARWAALRPRLREQVRQARAGRMCAWGRGAPLPRQH